MIGADGQTLGVLSIEEARQEAQRAGLDLVEVSPNAKPPVVKILNYGAYRYRLQKQVQQQKKKQKKIEIKGIRIGMRISQHDFDHKVSQARKFLEEGHKIKLELVMRGREQAYQLRDRALEKIDIFIEALQMPITREQKLTKQGNRLNVVLGKSNKTKNNQDHINAQNKNS